MMSERIELMREIVEKFRREEGAFLGSPATDAEIAAYNKTLEREFPAIPEGYAEFLKICDGLTWKDTEFWGTGAESGDEAVSLLGENDHRAFDYLNPYDRDSSTPPQMQWLFLGKSAGALFLYDSGNKVFIARGIKTMSAYIPKRFKTFTGLLAASVGGPLFGIRGDEEGEEAPAENIVNTLRGGAADDDPNALYALWLLHSGGKYPALFPEDDETASQWLFRAAELGVKEAITEVVMMGYTDGPHEGPA
jgi:hypothetical protein